ncbi:TetR/AcrR family transcriptional regulator [Rhodococcus sp. D2-41]|uniref:TetR/AcrR family transcriptional regulator n=1 Tax=Speluncibacter jeojiensis TaxID=2710754 RepID=A0A9X4M0L8_9ACTN|nr:TetR/AcrR family transcriptional regulator [Rhodococcus sp. D2-41]MDG3010295.1 TetR/AcrR family transcriptional regulator [Rhodococcus sp. D2-41]MDG3015808.1 TetR/AcrR family transcriptional regulator [Corynebacteriales bacterium D3-21]
MRSRRKILDATVELIRRDTFADVSIAAVAQRAGVTRQTVYSNFGTREELVSQAIGGLAVRVLGDIRARLDAADTPVEYVVELIVFGRYVMRTNPVLMTLLNVEPGNPIFDAGMIDRAKPVARELLSPLESRISELGKSLDDIVEITLLLALSVVFFDDEPVRSDDALRAFLTRWLGPALRAD